LATLRLSWWLWG